MSFSSFVDLCDVHRDQRRQVIAQVHQAEVVLWELFQRYGAGCASHLEQFDKMPRQTADEYRETHVAMLARIGLNKRLRSFIREGKAGDRLVDGGQHCTKSDIARKVVAKQRRTSKGAPVTGSSGDLQTEAVRILDAEVKEVETQLAAFDAAWAATTSSARALLKCVEELRAAGLVPSGNLAMANLEASLLLVYTEEVRPSGLENRRRRALDRVKNSLKRMPLRSYLINSMNSLAVAIVAGLPQAAEREKHKILADASRLLIAQLDCWREPIRSTSLETAVLGLHFTFTSARRGLGSLAREEAERYQRILQQIPREDVLNALASLVERGVLPGDELDVFRYTPSVWQAVQTVRSRTRAGRSHLALRQNNSAAPQKGA